MAQPEWPESTGDGVARARRHSPKGNASEPADRHRLDRTNCLALWINGHRVGDIRCIADHASGLGGSLL